MRWRDEKWSFVGNMNWYQHKNRCGLKKTMESLDDNNTFSRFSLSKIEHFYEIYSFQNDWPLKFHYNYLTSYSSYFCLKYWFVIEKIFCDNILADFITL